MNAEAEPSGTDHPEYVTSGLLRAVSSSLGGDLVIWMTVDRDDAVTIAAVVDPVPEAQVTADRLPRGPASSERSFVVEIARRGEPVLVPVLDLADHPIETFPEPWPEYLRTYPIHGFIAVPTPTPDGETTLLIAGRRRRHEPYGEDDLALVSDASRRLAGVDPIPTDEVAEPVPEHVDRLRRARARRRVAAAGLGLALPLVVLAMLLPADEPSHYLPGGIFLLACVASAIVGGTPAAVIAAITSTIALWWGIIEPRYSFQIGNPADATIGLVLFAVGATGVTFVVWRVDCARADERAERRLSDTLLDQAPVAMAVFDRDLRFRRVNRQMEVINERSVAEHMGLRPSDLSPVVGHLYEPLLARVRDRGESVSNQKIVMSMPEVGLQRHWRVNAEPLYDDVGRIVGVSAAVADETDEVVARERADVLLRLSQALSNAITDEQVATTVSRHLVEVFHGRSAVLLRTGGVLHVMALAGFGDEDAERWREMTLDVGAASPLADAAVSRRPLTLTIRRVRRSDPALAERRTINWDSACLAVGSAPTAGSAPLKGCSTSGGRTAGDHQQEHDPDRDGGLPRHPRPARIVATNAAASAGVPWRPRRDDRQRRIGRAIRSDSGEISDFELEFANLASLDGAGRAAAEIIGRRVCDLYPQWRTSGLFDRFCHVVETGEPFQVERLHYVDRAPDGSTVEGWWSLQVSKLGDGYIVASRDVTATVLAEEAARLAERQREAERITVELLQSAALPPALPEVPGLTLAAAYVPCDVEQPIGGDWYDAFLLDGDRLAVVIADVAGHGQAAAAFMLQVRNVFRAIAVEHAEPGEVMFRANEVTFRLNDPDGPFVTCCYAVLHLPTMRLHWAQAGHFSPMLLHRGGAVESLPEQPGLPLALYTRQRYATSVVQLQRGDRIVMFTDGLVERRAEHLDIGLGRLQRRLAELDEAPTKDLVEAIVSEVTDRFDDLAVIGLGIDL